MNPAYLSRPSWNEYFVALCRVVATRSTDPNTKVGCVIVNQNKRIVATGYNGYPPGCDDGNLPCTSPEKYDWMTHAEENAIASCGSDLRGCGLYVHIMPCPRCMRLIIAAGIKHVYYFQDYESKGCMNNNVVLEMSRQTGVHITRIHVENVPLP